MLNLNRALLAAGQFSRASAEIVRAWYEEDQLDPEDGMAAAVDGLKLLFEAIERDPADQALLTALQFWLEEKVL